MQVGIDVDDVASVDSERGEQTRILSGSLEICTHFAIQEENRIARISAFDTAVEVVPLVDPAKWRCGTLDIVEVGYRLALSDFPQECKCPVKNAAIGLAGYENYTLFLDAAGCERKCIPTHVSLWLESWIQLADLVDSAYNNRRFGRQFRADAQRAAKHPTNAAQQFGSRRIQELGIPSDGQGCGKGCVLVGGIQGSVPQPCSLVCFRKSAAGQKKPNGSNQTSASHRSGLAENENNKIRRE